MTSASNLPGSIPSQKESLIRILQDKAADVPIDTGLATFLNPYSYLRLRQSVELCAEMDAIFVDGVSLVILLRLAGIRVRRCSMDMTSLAPGVLMRAAADNRTIYFVGGPLGVAKNAADILRREIDLPAVEALAGYFDTSAHRDSAISKIAADRDSLVLVGMGAGVQEQFMIDLRRQGHSGLVYSCGGFFHQTVMAGRPKYYPRWVDRIHLRWLWRMVKEPQLISRYLIGYPRAVVRYICDLIPVLIASPR